MILPEEEAVEGAGGVMRAAAIPDAVFSGTVDAPASCPVSEGGLSPGLREYPNRQVGRATGRVAPVSSAANHLRCSGGRYS